MYTEFVNVRQGNVLFLILLAVALFAALSYAVTQAGRSGGKNISDEQADLDQAVDENCEVSVNIAIDRLKLINGCRDDDISYELPDGTNENANNPSDTSCFVFHPAGAGASPCGSYMEANITIGFIAPGNTTNFVPVGGGVYMRCNSWQQGFLGPTTWHCNDTFYSTDGSTRVDMCYNNTGWYTFAVNFCTQACESGSTHNSFMDGDSNINITNGYAVQNDGSVAPFNGMCSFTATEIDCACWN